MTEQDALRYLGIKRVRKISASTTTVEHSAGGAMPATELEQRMWALIKHLLSNN